MPWFHPVFLAAAVSLDSLAIGVSYGLMQVSIPLGSKLIVSLISALTVLIAVGMGDALGRTLSPEYANASAGVLLMLIGGHTLWRCLRRKPVEPGRHGKKRQPCPFLTFVARTLHIFQEPLQADADDSHSISGHEAIVLGVALALDAFAAGIGAGMMRYRPVLLAGLVAGANLVFLTSGLRMGEMKCHLPAGLLQWLPGLIIFSLGLMRFFI